MPHGGANDFGTYYINNQVTGDSKPSPEALQSFNGHHAPMDAYHNQGSWANYVNGGFSATTPPTPENVPHAVQPNVVLSREADTPQVVDEEEEEGEVLVGMGLYDTPEKQEEDPQLDRYRSTVTSLLGSAFKAEGAGKGLMLEQTWEPPSSPEDVDGEGDDEEDE